MKINWKLRVLNKTTLISLATVVIAFIYQVLGIIGIVPQISQDTIVNLVMTVINILAIIGVVIDPTTKGVHDSERAMGYTELG